MTKPSRQAPRFRGNVADGDIRLLRVFQAVAASGGFSGAEARLNKSKSAISADISDLEHRLGVRLCERGRAGFSLTAEGQQICEVTNDLLGDLERFRDRVNQVGVNLSGELVIYVIDNLVSDSKSPLAAAIGSFCDRHPDVFLHLISGSAQEVEQSILERRGDLGISVLASAHSALETIPLFSEDIYMFCGKRHPLYAIADKEIDGEMLRKHRVVESSILRAMTVEGLAAEDFKIRARANALDVRAIAILSGSFLGALPENYAAAWVQSGDMRPLLPSDMHERSAFHTIRHRATRPTRLVETFLSHLTQCSNAEPAALQD